MKKILYKIVGAVVIIHFLWHVVLAAVGIMHGSWLGWLIAAVSVAMYIIYHSKYLNLKKHHQYQHKNCDYES